MKNLQNIKTDIIDIVAGKCGDPFKKDFVTEEYELALLTADRKIAIRYDILHRYIIFFNKIVIPPQHEGDVDYLAKQKATDVLLDVTSFIEEHVVLINDVKYAKATDNELPTDQNKYHLYHAHNGISFNYSPRTENDKVEIHYISDINPEDYIDDSSAPIIPGKYETERINLTIHELAKLGIAKYGDDNPVNAKYRRIIQIYPDKGFDVELRKNDGPKIIKILQYP